MYPKYKIVHFERWCNSCTHLEDDAVTDPCWECTGNSVTSDGKPTGYEKRPEAIKAQVTKRKECE